MASPASVHHGTQPPLAALDEALAIFRRSFRVNPSPRAELRLRCGLVSGASKLLTLASVVREVAAE